MITCNICGREMDVPGEPQSRDCGGDCLVCMSEAGDPDAIREMWDLVFTKIDNINKILNIE